MKCPPDLIGGAWSRGRSAGKCWRRRNAGQIPTTRGSGAPSTAGSASRLLFTNSSSARSNRSSASKGCHIAPHQVVGHDQRPQLRVTRGQVNLLQAHHAQESAPLGDDREGLERRSAQPVHHIREQIGRAEGRNHQLRPPELTHVQAGQHLAAAADAPMPEPMLTTSDSPIARAGASGACGRTPEIQETIGARVWGPATPASGCMRPSSPK
jgi:hypothetical protein